MAHFKRKKTKQHVVIDCCYNERNWEKGNNPGRIPRKCRRQAQWYRDDGTLDNRYASVVRWQRWDEGTEPESSNG